VTARRVIRESRDRAAAGAKITDFGLATDHRHGWEAVPVGGLSLGLYNDLGAAARALLASIAKVPT
jgi:hypothetical protein